MSEIVLRSNKPDKASLVVKEALETEMLRVKYSRRLAKHRLKKFEEKYSVSSKEFINRWTAEDLEGGDMEYVEWAGEYKLSLILDERMAALNSIEHVSP